MNDVLDRTQSGIWRSFQNKESLLLARSLGVALTYARGARRASVHRIVTPSRHSSQRLSPAQRNGDCGPTLVVHGAQTTRISNGSQTQDQSVHPNGSGPAQGNENGLSRVWWSQLT